MAQDGRQSSVTADDEERGGTEGVLRAFLIADVRGYTRYTNQRGDEAGADLARRFAEVTRAAVAAHGGEVIELRGDEALAVFGSPRAAVRAAVEAQRRLRGSEDPQEALPLGVGIGIDAGEAVPIEGGYRGSALNVAARLCSLAGPGEILATETLSALAGRVPGVRSTPRKPVRVKGIEQPVRLVEIVPEGGLPPLPAPEEPAAQRPRLPRLVVLAALAAALAVGAGVLLLGGEGQAADLDANSLGRLDPGSGTVEEQVRVGDGPVDVVYGDGSLWVVNRAGASLWQVDPETRAVTDRIPVGKAPVAAAFGDGAVWVVDSVGRKLLRVDEGRVVDDTDVGNGASDVVFAGGAAWVANAVDGTVTRTDAATGRVTTVASGIDPVALAADSDALWVANRGGDNVVRIDLETRVVVESLPVGHEPSALAVGGGSLWVANAADGTVWRIDPPNRVRDTVEVGGRPSALAYADGSLWAANESTGAVARIRDGEVSAEQVGGAPTALAEADGELWVTALAARATHRGGTLRIAGAFPVTDPYFSSPGANVNPILNDGLVAYRAAGGPAGTTLVPDLAEAMPERTGNGKRYTFRLREGIRYSTGAEVRASHVRASFERMFAVESDAAGLYDTLLGGPACLEEPPACDLSRTILTDDEEGTVEFVLERPDPLFLYKLAFPPAWVLPPGMPRRRVETEPLPATGPYMIAEVDGERSMTLVRNPHFREWSRAAQPAGYPDRIVITRADGAELGLVRANRADALHGGVPPPEAERLAVRAPTRLHSVPINSIVYGVLNTTRPPFDDVRVRRALNLAVDRSAAVGALGGRLFGRPACQMLPPNVLGFRPYCPFTAGGGETGVWSGPDLAEAQALVRASGTTGDPVTLLTSPWPPLKGVGDVLARTLRKLGYRVAVRVVGGTVFDYYGALADPAERAQIGPFRWGLEFPVPGDVFGPLLGCEAPNSVHFCDPALDRRVRQATELLASRPTASAEPWAELDREVVDEALVVPLANESAVELVSERVGNVEIHPVWGPMYGQMWVR